MEAGDMFDVLHVLYEEDVTPLWEQHIDVKDRVREVMYPMLYGRNYKFASTKASGAGQQGEPPDYDGPVDVPAARSTSSREVKPYIPVTDPEDLMKILDAPMGG